MNILNPTETSGHGGQGGAGNDVDLFTSPRVWGVFFLLAACAFAYFFIEGRKLVVSTDNYYYIIPNLIFGRDFLFQGDFFPWNRFMLAGIDFSSSNYNFMYSPVYWLMYLFPRDYFMTGFTVVNFGLLWAVGVAAFHLFREETGSGWGAMFGAVAYQAGGSMFFSLNMYPYFTGYVLSVVILYLLWTEHRRSRALTFFCITIAVGSLILSCHIVRAFLLMALVCICGGYRLWPKRFTFRTVFSSRTLVFLGAVACGVLIAAIRLIPLMFDLEGSDRLVSFPFSGFFHSGCNFYYSINTVLPEIFPLRQPAAPIFTDQSPVTYAYTVPYMGVIGLLLAVYGVMRTRKAHVFWTASFIVAFMINSRISPIGDIFTLVFYPTYHAFLLKILLPIPFCVMIAYGAKALCENTEHRLGYWVPCLIGLALAASAVAYFIGDPKWIMLGKIAVVIIVPATVATVTFYNRGSRNFDALLLAFSAIGIASVFYAYAYYGFPFPKKDIACIIGHYIVTTLTFALAIISLRSWRREGKYRYATTAAILLGGMVISIVLYAPNVIEPYDSRDGKHIIMYGAIRLVLISGFFLQVMLYVKRNRVATKIALLILLCALAVDLSMYNRMHADVITRSFWPDRSLSYPATLKDVADKLLKPQPGETNDALPLDLKNYRVPQPSAFLGIGGKMHYTHIPYLYGLPSFGGVNGFRPATFLSLLNFFSTKDDPPIKDGGARPEYIISPRFNDIIGIGYDLVDGKIVRRPGALSRFTLFHEGRVVADAQAMLDELKSDGFDPKQTLLLTAQPDGASIPAAGAPSKSVEYAEISGNRLKLEVQSEANALLLFNDSYDAGWSATVDGRPAGIVRANTTFMAIAVPPGSHEIVFSFLPTDWLPRTIVSLLGVALWLLGALWLYYRDRAAKQGGLSFPVTTG